VSGGFWRLVAHHDGAEDFGRALLEERCNFSREAMAAAPPLTSTDFCFFFTFP
jgi:hypothetical protein